MTVENRFGDSNEGRYIDVNELVESARNRLFVKVSQGSSEGSIRATLGKEKSRISILVNAEGVIFISDSDHSDIKNKDEIKGYYSMGSLQFTKGVLTHSWLNRDIDILLIRSDQGSYSYVGNSARDNELRRSVISKVQDELREIYPEIYFSPEVVLQDWRTG